MGDPKKSRRLWQGPRHPWKKESLQNELALIGKFGLRNKRELWLANSVLKSYRAQASAILGLSEAERAAHEKELIQKLSNLGLLGEDSVLDNVLGLSVDDILERRLQTVVMKLGLAHTPHQSRQLIVHGHVKIGDHRVTAPGYMVSRKEEPQISCDLVLATVPESAANAAAARGA